MEIRFRTAASGDRSASLPVHWISSVLTEILFSLAKILCDFTKILCNELP